MRTGIDLKLIATPLRCTSNADLTFLPNEHVIISGHVDYFLQA